MKTTTNSCNSRVYRRLLHSAFAAALLSVLLLALNVPSSYADSATWNLNPTSGDWNTAANLADGSTVVAGSNTFQAHYQGGDENDLTLTVVP